MRQKLLDGALNLFVTNGYYNTSIRDIIKHSAVGAGSFYNYFSSKEEILEILLEEFANDVIKNIKAYYKVEQSLLERFIETKRITMLIFSEHAQLSELYCKCSGTSKQIDDNIKRFEDKLLSFYERNLEYGISEGVFRDVPVKPVCYSILATEKYLLFRWIVLKDISKDEMIHSVVSFHQTLASGLVKENV